MQLVEQIKVSNHLGGNVVAEANDSSFGVTMRHASYLTLCTLVSMAGCLGAIKPVEVRITPDAYVVGDIKSALATPAVDEVVRIGAGEILIVTCFATRPAKVLQFQTELRARTKAAMKMIVEKKC